VTLKVKAASIAPDLRFGAAGALAEPAAAVLIGDVTVTAEGCLPQSPVIPRYLRYAHREAVLVADGAASIAEFELCLGERIRALADSGSLDDLAAAVIAMDAVDRCFRDAELWPNNIYLAGTGTLRVVLDMAGDDPELLSRGPEAVLRELAALELAYLFPVAGKFCAGTYDGQIQYRLNGWGRTLADRLAAGKVGADRTDLYRRAITHHLDREYQHYVSFLSELQVGRQYYRGNTFDKALMLPIPVLS
jgi:hypothetical protein